VPEIKGALAGKITSRFDLDEAGHWQLALPELKVDGKLNQYPLALQGRLSGNDKMEWTIPALALQSGPNRLQAKGSLTTQAWKLDADLDAPKLGASTRVWEGTSRARCASPATSRRRA
jgi:translocation and assembly module TamB